MKTIEQLLIRIGKNNFLKRYNRLMLYYIVSLVNYIVGDKRLISVSIYLC